MITKHPFVNRCRRRSLPRAEARELIARRGALSSALRDPSHGEDQLMVPRNPFTKDKPGRKCAECGRGGGVTWFHGVPLHPRCMRKRMKEGRVDLSRYQLKKEG